MRLNIPTNPIPTMARKFNRRDVKRENERILQELEEEFTQALEELRKIEDDLMGDVDDYDDILMSREDRWREHEQDMDAIDRAHGKRTVFQHHHDFDHRGNQVGIDEAHFAFDDRETMEFNERQADRIDDILARDAWEDMMGRTDNPN